MKIVSGIIYSLQIPFVQSFSHSARARKYSDSIVLKLEDDSGHTGFGEGVARPYVTGETVESCVGHIQNVLWPAACKQNLPNLAANGNPLQSLGAVREYFVDQKDSNVIAWNASRAAFELAVIDLSLKAQRKSLSVLIPPIRTEITYSGIISADSTNEIEKIAKQYKLFGIKQVKIKTTGQNDLDRIKTVRDVLGPSASLRVDANGAYSVKEAIEAIRGWKDYGIETVEQPIPRGKISDLKKVKSESPIPIMVDESLVTLDDAEELISEDACDYFNLRISKCGGIYPTLRLAKMAAEANIKVQLGSQVGETAILSAAGRHVAAHLKDLKFVEGSFGRLLLTEDISATGIHFGHGGKAPLLKAPGLGIEVRENILRKYAHKVITLGDA